MKLVFERLCRRHKRKEFDCGETALNEYLVKMASQDAKRNYASIFVGVPYENPDRIVGYYALSATSVRLDAIPAIEALKLPRYPDIPAALLGRFCVDKNFQRQGIGKILVIDALKRLCAAELAWAFLFVEAKNKNAVEFYKKFYFSQFVDESKRLWMTRKQAEKIAGALADKAANWQ